MAAERSRPRTTIDSTVLETIRRRSVTTRVEIARELGVTPATVTNAVKRLMAAGLVIEAGHARSTGGKRASLLRINDEARWALGCTIEPARLSLAAVDTTGALRSRSVLPLPLGREPATIVETLRQGLDLMSARDSLSSATGIGFAMPSTLPAELRTALTATTAELGIPALETDEATCAALGSFWSGEQPEQGLTATVHANSHLAIALLQDGAPIQHAAEAASVLDHVCIDPNGHLCDCGMAGCLNLYAAGSALVEQARHTGLAADLDVNGIEESVNADAVLIALTATRGDDRAEQIIDRAARALMQAVWPVVAGLGVDTVVLTGTWIQAAPAPFSRAATQYARDYGKGLGRPVTVKVSEVQPHPCAVGAAVLALKSFLSTTGD
nr:ROK family transcriptional regulator [Brachybacterium muris]